MGLFGTKLIGNGVKWVWDIMGMTHNGHKAYWVWVMAGIGDNEYKA